MHLPTALLPCYTSTNSQDSQLIKTRQRPTSVPRASWDKSPVSRRSDRPRPRQQTLIQKLDHSSVNFAASALGSRSLKNLSRQIR